MDDTELWDAIDALGGEVTVGLKNPGAARGIWRDEILIPASDQGQFSEAIDAMPGVTVVATDDRRPLLIATMESEEDLTHLRGRPFVDYVEPARMVVYPEGGCDWRPTTGAGDPTTSLGDLYSPVWDMPKVRISEAWRRAQGADVTIGVVDTGVLSTQNQLRSGPEPGFRFDSGQSGDRWAHHWFTKGTTTNGPCVAHGTRVAGVATAPMNGQSAVGVAWQSNLVSVRSMDTVWGGELSASNIYNGIEFAATYTPDGEDDGYMRRRIINMSFGSHSYSAIKDEIVKWNTRGRLFIAASGAVRYVAADVVFPARMTEVIAVSAINKDGTNASGSVRYGPSVELTLPREQRAPGEPAAVDLVGQTSGTAAAVSGIASLVWSQYPNEYNFEIRERLQKAGSSYPNRTDTRGFGILNAMKAVGGMTYMFIYAPAGAGVDTRWGPVNVQAGASHDGDPSFTYDWTIRVTDMDGSSTLWNENTQSVSFTLDDDDCEARLNVTVTQLDGQTTKFDGHTVAVWDSQGLPRDCSGSGDPRDPIDPM